MHIFPNLIQEKKAFGLIQGAEITEVVKPKFNLANHDLFLRSDYKIRIDIAKLFHLESSRSSWFTNGEEYFFSSLHAWPYNSIT